MQAYKVVVVGDGAVGKTCLLMCYTQKMFPREYIPTVFDNFSKNVSHNGNLIRLDLYDTAGQEDYDRLRVICYPNTDVFLVCYSVDSTTSVNNINEKWVEEISHHAKEAMIILVGLKKDIRTDSKALADLRKQGKELVQMAEVQKAAEKAGETMNQKVPIIECSSLKMENVDQVFETAIGVALNKQGKQDQPCCTVL